MQHGLDSRAGPPIADVAREQQVDRPADEIVAGEAGQRLHVMVREDDPAVGVRDHQALGRRLQQRAGLDQASKPGERGIVARARSLRSQMTCLPTPLR